MRRFWRQVSVEDGEVRLDGRPVRTPGRAPLVLPTPALAEAVANEWRSVEGEMDARTMPLTGLANAAIDRIAPDPAAFGAGLIAYGESDLLCYRAAAPATLVARQAASWDPLLDWARTRYDVGFTLVTGIMHQPQPAATIRRLSEAVAIRSAFELAALSPLVTVSGSLVIALALVERAIDGAAAWRAATVDDAWQAEQWGEDPLAVTALADRQGSFDAGVAFLDSLRER